MTSGISLYRQDTALEFREVFQRLWNELLLQDHRQCCPQLPSGGSREHQNGCQPGHLERGNEELEEFKIFGVRVMDTRNGRTHLREPWKWPFVGALICWPIALGLSQVAIMAIRARDLSETLAAIAGAAVFWVVLPVYTYRM